MSYAYINSVKGNALSDAVTSSMDTTGADLLIIGLACNNGYNTTPTDSKSNTWTQLTSYTQGNVRVRLWYCKPTSVGASHTFTAPGGIIGTIFAAAFSGAKATSPADQQNGSNAFASSLATGSITPSEDDCLIFGLYGVNGTGAAPLSVDSGMTEIQEQPFVAGTSYGGSIAYKIQTTAAAINPTFTRSNSNGQAATVASFLSEPAAAGPANVKTIDGIAIANIKTVDGIDIANVKSYNGIT